MNRATVRARYTAGNIGSRSVPSYIEEAGVHPDRNTETYASLTLHVDSARWEGVPFTLRSGKALEANSAEIAVHFSNLPRYLLEQWPGVEPNVLRLGLTDPYVRMATTLNGPDQHTEYRELEAHVPASRRTPYANLILAMIRSDPTLFIRGDEAEEAWRIIDPVTRAWSSGEVPMRDYAAGTAAPGPLLS